VQLMSEPKTDQIEIGNHDKNSQTGLAVGWTSACGPCVAIDASSLADQRQDHSGRGMGVVGHAFALGGAGFRPPCPH